MDFDSVGRPLLGGALIGVAASLLMLFNGRIAGVSGIVAKVLPLQRQQFWRVYFVAGLILGGIAMLWSGIALFRDETGFGYLRTVLAGLCVGCGTLLGSGCTSGHGVCGISRLSLRSIVATLIFILTGMLTVAVLR